MVFRQGVWLNGKIHPATTYIVLNRNSRQSLARHNENTETVFDPLNRNSFLREHALPIVECARLFVVKVHALMDSNLLDDTAKYLNQIVAFGQ